MASKRKLTEPTPGDKRYVRRKPGGQFGESQDDVGRSLAADRRKKAKTTVPKGQGDRGDQRAPAGKKSARKSSARKTGARKSTARKTGASKKRPSEVIII
jgi:hypothetical protein